jgi:hypothetical protein
MSAGRALLIALGLLIAAGGIFLVVRGFRHADAAGAVPPDPPAADARDHHGKTEEKAPRWQSFVRPGGHDTPSRPVVRFARGLANPFDRLAAGGRRGGARPESANPGLRLEGVSTGTQPVALISGHAVREGDTISGFHVARIGRSAVTLVGPRGARLGLALGKGR